MTAAAPAVEDAHYYLGHFWQVVDGVCGRYAHLLSAEETAFCRRLRALPPDALCLYVRLANRKGPYFRLNRLHYDEIACLRSACDALAAQGLALVCREGADIHASFIPRPEPLGREALLACFTHREVEAALAGVLPQRFARKARLCRWLAHEAAEEAWLPRLLAAEPVIRLAPGDPWRFVRFLFFGELTDNLSDFVTRELGYVVTEAAAEAQLVPHFRTRAEAEDGFRMASAYAVFRALRGCLPAAAVWRWWQDLGIRREALAEAAHPPFDRLAERLGRLLEREGEDEAALALYAATPMAPARERTARLLIKHGRRGEAAALCRAMLADPCHAEEAYAARQLDARLNRQSRTSQARAMLKAGEPLTLAPHPRVEEAVLNHYRAAGWQGAHTENGLWNGLLGLLCWDIIYDPAYGAFHSPMQAAPADFYRPSFRVRRAEALESRLAELAADPQASLKRMEATYAAKAGFANPLVGWHEGLMPVIAAMVARVPAEAAAAVLREMLGDLRHGCRGFPDLFLWKGGAYRFMEVKSPNDQLSPRQYHWLDCFARLGISVGIQRVLWRAAVEVGAESR